MTGCINVACGTGPAVHTSSGQPPKTRQIVSCSDADGGRDFGVSPFPEPPASCFE